MAFPSPFYRWRAHPWHGISAGEDAPLPVNAFIEITPFDVVKYAVDKETGYLKVDRPQQGSSSPPVLYRAERAQNVVRAAMRDHGDTFGER